MIICTPRVITTMISRAALGLLLFFNYYYYYFDKSRSRMSIVLSCFIYFIFTIIFSPVWETGMWICAFDAL